MTNYYHIHMANGCKGYFTEESYNRIMQWAGNADIKFLAGPFDREGIDELRNESRKMGRTPLRIIVDGS